MFLELNGSSVLEATNDDVYELVVSIAAGQLDVPEIAERLRTLVDE